MALVSVVIPTCDDARYLGESVPSALAQEWTGDLEVVVVDDGSRVPAQTVWTCEDPRVHWHRQARGGVSAARNAGPEAARGEYVAFLDADDLMLPGRIAAQVALMEARPEIGLVGGDITRRDLEGREESWGLFKAFGETIAGQAVDCGGAPDGSMLSEAFRDQVLRRYPFNTSVVTVRRSALEGGAREGEERVRFDPALTCWEDWDFVARVARRARVGYIRRPVTLYRKRAGSITTTPDPEKFAGRGRMFARWRSGFEGLSDAMRRELRRAEAESYRTASWEWRGGRPRAGCGLRRAGVGRPCGLARSAVSGGGVGRAALKTFVVRPSGGFWSAPSCRRTPKD